MRTQGPTWATRLRAFHKCDDLSGSEQEGFRSSWGGEQPWGGHLGVGYRGLEIPKKPACHTQASRRAARPSVCGGLAGPLKRHLSSDRTVVRLSFHIRYKLRKDDF